MVGVDVVKLVLVVEDALPVLLLSLVGLLLDGTAAVGEPHLVDLGLQGGLQGALGVGVLQEEGLDDEGGEDVEDEQHADHVERDEEDPGGFRPCTKDNFDLDSISRK